MSYVSGKSWLLIDENIEKLKIIMGLYSITIIAYISFQLIVKRVIYDLQYLSTCQCYKISLSSKILALMEEKKN